MSSEYTHASKAAYSGPTCHAPAHSPRFQVQCAVPLAAYKLLVVGLLPRARRSSRRPPGHCGSAPVFLSCLLKPLLKNSRARGQQQPARRAQQQPRPCRPPPAAAASPAADGWLNYLQPCPHGQRGPGPPARGAAALQAAPLCHCSCNDIPSCHLPADAGHAPWHSASRLWRLHTYGCLRSGAASAVRERRRACCRAEPGRQTLQGLGSTRIVIVTDGGGSQLKNGQGRTDIQGF